MRFDYSTMATLTNVILSMLVTLATAQSPDDREYKGRHVCSHRQQITYRKPITQSFRKAVFNEELQRNVYQTVYRTVLRLQMSDKLVPGCCPGWSKRSQRDLSCMEPVCEEECVHGKCIRPGICLCETGWSGYRCDADVNECRGSRHKCQQQCINTDGSYECACQEGFKLGEDNTSCVLCLTCSQEFQALQQTIQAMDQRIGQLETEKQNLQTNLTSALDKYDEAIQALHVVTPTTSGPTSTSEPGLEPYMPLDRLASLSQQISILEERMASCMCDDYLLT